MEGAQGRLHHPARLPALLSLHVLAGERCAVRARACVVGAVEQACSCVLSVWREWCGVPACDSCCRAI